ncbi:MAG: hypothetical protein U0840_02005 [Gemmataceae bacterium]
MPRYSFLLLCLLLCLILGCGAKSGVQSSTVKGQVKLDGKPMADGEILFSVPGQVPSTLAVKDGAYSGSANQGKARVEIRAYKTAAPVMMGGQVVNQGSKENYLPDRYNSNTTLSAEVTASGPNEFNFEVTSK